MSREWKKHREQKKESNQKTWLDAKERSDAEIQRLHWSLDEDHEMYEEIKAEFEKRFDCDDYIGGNLAK